MQDSTTGSLAEEETRDVKQEDVTTFPAGAAMAAVSGMATRFDWGDRRGEWKLRLNWPGVRAGQKAFVSIAEGAPGGPGAGKFLGAAKYHLFNVAPRPGGVDIWINIEWSSPIRLYADYLVVD
jgi:hypothetical protein